jgi:hypothetical protein
VNAPEPIPGNPFCVCGHYEGNHHPVRRIGCSACDCKGFVARDPTPAVVGRVGDWFQTYSGVEFYIYDPRPEDIHVQDIAHALAMQCRFNGHCRSFYSVAEHSVRVAMLLIDEETDAVAFWGLMHDASEAYCGDMVRPMKRGMPEFRAVEAKLTAAICTRFRLDPIEPPAVKVADNRLLATERRDLMGWPPKPYRVDEGCQPLAAAITPWPPEIAEREFLAWFRHFERRGL